MKLTVHNVLWWQICFSQRCGLGIVGKDIKKKNLYTGVYQTNKFNIDRARCLTVGESGYK